MCRRAKASWLWGLKSGLNRNRRHLAQGKPADFPLHSPPASWGRRLLVPWKHDGTFSGDTGLGTAGPPSPPVTEPGFRA